MITMMITVQMVFDDEPATQLTDCGKLEFGHFAHETFTTNYHYT